MADVKICDAPGCGKVIKGEQVKVYSKKVDDCLVEISRSTEKDLCAECQRKLFAKGASTVWDDLKQKRKPKTNVPKLVAA